MWELTKIGTRLMKIALMQLEKGDYETARLINEVMFDLNKLERMGRYMAHMQEEE